LRANQEDDKIALTFSTAQQCPEFLGVLGIPCKAARQAYYSDICLHLIVKQREVCQEG
jgi:hypothetical protein